MPRSPTTAPRKRNLRKLDTSPDVEFSRVGSDDVDNVDGVVDEEEENEEENERPQWWQLSCRKGWRNQGINRISITCFFFFVKRVDRGRGRCRGFGPFINL